MKYAFIRSHRTGYRVEVFCRVLGVSRQGYYAWCKRRESPRSREDRRLAARGRIVHAESKSRYGSPRVHATLREEGIRCGEKRVARLMQVEGLRAKAGRKFKATTDSHHDRPLAPDLVRREFTAPAPNRVWVGDITYLWTAEGWLYLAVFIDLFSRRVVGWAVSTRITAHLVTLALARAIARRRPGAGLIVHTDRGAQYGAESYRRALAAIQALQSMGSTGDCYDNAACESFFHSFKVEAVHGEDLVTRREMEYEVFDYIEHFYNKKRKHSALGFRSPEQFETEKQRQQKATA